MQAAAGLSSAEGESESQQASGTARSDNGAPSGEQAAASAQSDSGASAPQLAEGILSATEYSNASIGVSYKAPSGFELIDDEALIGINNFDIRGGEGVRAADAGRNVVFVHGEGPHNESVEMSVQNTAATATPGLSVARYRDILSDKAAQYVDKNSGGVAKVTAVDTGDFSIGATSCPSYTAAIDSAGEGRCMKVVFILSGDYLVQFRATAPNEAEADSILAGISLA